MEKWGDDIVLRLVVSAVEEKGRDSNLGDVRKNRPISERAGDVEFRRAEPA